MKKAHKDNTGFNENLDDEMEDITGKVLNYNSKKTRISELLQEKILKPKNAYGSMFTKFGKTTKRSSTNLPSLENQWWRSHQKIKVNWKANTTLFKHLLAANKQKEREKRTKSRTQH